MQQLTCRRVVPAAAALAAAHHLHLPPLHTDIGFVHAGVACLQPVTCDNILPVKAPGQAFTCPANREFDPTKATAKGPSVENCCSKVRMDAVVC